MPEFVPTLDNLAEWDWEAAIEEGTDVDSQIVGTWRWGTDHYRVFEFGGQLLGVHYRMQPEHGIDCDNKPEVHKVKAITKTITDYVRDKQ